MFLDHSLIFVLLYIAIPCWNVPYMTPFRDKFPSLFENVNLGSLKSLFQIDQQFNMSLYLMEAIALEN